MPAEDEIGYWRVQVQDEEHGTAEDNVDRFTVNCEYWIAPRTDLMDDYIDMVAGAWGDDKLKDEIERVWQQAEVYGRNILLVDILLRQHMLASDLLRVLVGGSGHADFWTETKIPCDLDYYQHVAAALHAAYHDGYEYDDEERARLVDDLKRFTEAIEADNAAYEMVLRGIGIPFNHGENGERQ